jgi:hypothetical protein
MGHDQCFARKWLLENVMGARDPNEGPSLPFQASDDIAAVGQHGCDYFFFFAPFLAGAAGVAGASVSGSLPIVMI